MAAMVFVVAAICTLTAVVWNVRLDSRLDPLTSDLANAGNHTKTVPQSEREDFTAALPNQTEVGGLLHRFSRSLMSAAEQSGTQLVGLSQRAASSSTALVAAEVSFGLRGSYPSIKAVVAEALPVARSAVIQSADIRQVAGTEFVEGRFVVLIAAKPMPAPARG